MSDPIEIVITRQTNYRFLVDFGPNLPTTLVDEPAPLGEGAGPSPEKLLAAVVANCLAASLVFAHAKYREDPGALKATAICRTGRNESKRLRIQGMDVTITLGVEPKSLPHFERALSQFEDFCTVSQSVKSGIPYTLTVLAPDGTKLK